MDTMSSAYQRLSQKIERGNIVAGIIGLGYVGLPLATLFAKKGIKVIGFDIDVEKIHKLLNSQSYISDVENNLLSELLARGNFQPTAKFRDIEKADAVILCLPTPLDKYRIPDLRYIEETAVQLKRILRNGHIIILESTSFPGTTEEVLKKILDESGLKIEEDYFLGYSPERINPADKIFKIEDIPKIVSGYGNKSLELISLLYGHVFKTIVKANSIKAAESAKLLENIYRAVNISLINSMKIVLDAMGIDIYEVINLASTKPFGFQPFYPSPGMGGHCIPIDPFYLSYKAREFGVTAKFIELAGELDHTMPGYYFERILKKLNDLGILLKSANVLIVGVAYKPDTNDTRESPAIVFIEKFLDYKANVSYHDPLVPKLGPTRKFPKEMSSISLESELSKFDFVVLVTPHSSLDYEYLVENSKILFDIRNAIYKKLNVKFPNVYVI